ncbi:MAG: Tagatose-bisphosphate aldolase [Candidatus Curtissbacteria bacterium GW2011_GWA1_40_47]|nr:MAG: Tagatose-bisphosphate aldolase [Candidatus Curtissbacteria bacterium GW2011_GWA1_40_47]
MTARDWFLKAQTGGWAIGAFNADNLEILKAICLAAKNKKSPVMVEFSPGEVDYFGLRNIVDLVKNAREEYRIPILLNLDHGRKVEDCLAAVNMGSSTSSGSSSFDLIHFDGSDSELEENIHNTKKVVEAAHTKGLLVEGEIDKIPGASEIHDQDLDSELVKKSYTDPQKAAKFVSETGIDIFAFGSLYLIPFFRCMVGLEFQPIKLNRRLKLERSLKSMLIQS